MQILNRRLTYPTKCPECKAAVFFHTNGNGDAVFLDSLGPPWPVHGCFYAYHGGKLKSSFADYRARMVDLYGRVRPGARSGGSRGPRTVGWTYAPPARRRDPRSSGAQAPRPEDIVRHDPSNYRGRWLTVSGVLRELHVNRKLTTQIAAGSIGYAVLYRALGSDEYSQITIIDKELLSYTAWLPVPDLSVPVGTLVRVELERADAVTHSIYVCRSLAMVEFGSEPDPP